MIKYPKIYWNWNILSTICVKCFLLDLFLFCIADALQGAIITVAARGLTKTKHSSFKASSCPLQGSMGGYHPSCLIKSLWEEKRLNSSLRMTCTNPQRRTEYRNAQFCNADKDNCRFVLKPKLLTSSSSVWWPVNERITISLSVWSCISDLTVIQFLPYDLQWCFKCITVAIEKSKSHGVYAAQCGPPPG